MAQRLMQKDCYKRALKNLRNYRQLEERADLLRVAKENLIDELSIAPTEHRPKIESQTARVNFWLGQYETAKRIIERAIEALQGDEREILARHYINHEKIKDICAAMGIDSRQFHFIFRSGVDRVAFALYGVDGLTPYARAEYLCNVFTKRV